MKQRYVYLLEHCQAKQPTNVGVFSSWKRAKAALRKLRKDYAYVIYKLPLNFILTKGRKLEDQQGIFDHRHYGTNDVQFVEMDEKGNVLREGRRKEFFWPK